MKKIISTILAALVIISSTIPTLAATNLNSAGIYDLKQSASMCIVNSVAMLFRRQAVIDGNENWKIINESAIRNYSGNMASTYTINNVVTYKNSNLGLNMKTTTETLYSMKKNGYKRNSNPGNVKNKVKAYLDKHPEGVVIYIYTKMI